MAKIESFCALYVIIVLIVVGFFSFVFVKDDWEVYKKNFKKVYLNEKEDQEHYENFIKNADKIKIHNQKFANGEETYKMRHNRFSDMSWKKIPKMDSNSIPHRSHKTSEFNFSMEVPDSLSYQKYCLPILDQGDCESSWAFASLAQIEVQLKRKDESYSTQLSPQYAVDCAGIGRCEGARINDAFNFYKYDGIASLADYPYNAKNQTCNISPTRIPTTIKTINSWFLNGNEDVLKKIIAEYGPVVTLIEVTENFLSYGEGIFIDKSCPNNCGYKNGHAVVIVGYGKDYWLVRNSYGKDWGESGYVRMIKDSSESPNNCNIACHIFSAEVET